MTGLRAASFELAYEVRDDQHVYARASSVIVAYDLENARARRLADDELVVLKEYTS